MHTLMNDVFKVFEEGVIGCLTHPDFEGAHRLGDVPDLLFAKIRKCNWMLAQVFAHTAGHANSPGFGECLQPRSDIDAIAKNIAVLHHHVADIDSNTQKQSLRFLELGIFVGEQILNLNCAVNYRNHTCKLSEYGISGRARYPTAKVGNGGVDDQPMTG
jgi:hypothetical protein